MIPLLSNDALVLRSQLARSSDHGSFQARGTFRDLPRAQSRRPQVVRISSPPRRARPPARPQREIDRTALARYPGEGGAHKYVLQSKFIDTLDAQARGVPLRAHGQADDSWKIVYEGRENTVKVTGLFANSVYRFRVRAVNVADSASVLSDLAQVSTMSSWTGLALQPKNAHEVFTVDCTDDIVVGDTILFTERLYVDKDGRLTENPESRPSAKGSRGMAVSVESFLAGSARSKAQFIGERTIAARVLKDAYRSAAQTSGGGTTNGRSASRRRDLRLEVIWSTVSTKEAVAHVLTKETLIEREQARIFQFETFRMLWHEEARRLSARAELYALRGVRTTE